MADRKWEAVPKDERKWEPVPVTSSEVKAKYKKKDKPKRGYRDKDEGGFTEFLRGVGLSAAKTGVGFADWVGMDVDPHAKKALELWEQDIQDGSGWGDAGGIVGDIAQFAAPGAAVLKGVKAAKGGFKTIMAGESALAGLMGANRMPLNDETRTGNAAFDAGMGAAGVGVGKVVGKGLKKGMDAISMKRSEAGQKMMDLSPDYNFSPASVLESNPVKNIQHLMEELPLTARRTRKVAARDLEEYNKVALRTIADNPEKITKSGNPGFKQLKTQFNNGYNSAYKDIGEVPEQLEETLMQQVYALTKEAPLLLDEAVTSPSGLKEIRVLDSIIDRAGSLTQENTTNGLKNLDKYIKELTESLNPSKQNDLRGILKELKKTTRDFMPEGKAEKLNSLDKRWPDLMALNEATAAGTRNQNEGVWMPKQLLGGTEKLARGMDFSEGGGPMREMADMGGRAFKPADVESQPSLLSLIMRLGKAVPGGSLMPMKTVSNIMTGQTGLGKGGKIENVVTPAALISLMNQEKSKRKKKKN